MPPSGDKVAPQNCHFLSHPHLWVLGHGAVIPANAFPPYLFTILRFSDAILATILATKSEMCGQKFELKIDNVRFVGHPTLLQHALGQVWLSSAGRIFLGWVSLAFTGSEDRNCADVDASECVMRVADLISHLPSDVYLHGSWGSSRG